MPAKGRKRAEKAARILIVDDHPIVRKGIAKLLADEGDFAVCGEADSPEMALQTVAATKPDVVIVDLTLPGSGGFGLIKDLRVWHPRVRILVLSMHDESLYAERVLRAGAVGYIMKQEATDHIVEAVRRVLAGQVYLSEPMSARMLHRFVGEEGAASSSSIETLSDRELEIFHLIGQGLSTREVAGRLFLSVKTVETHLEHIKSKLGLESGRELVRYATKWAEEEL